MYHNKFIPPEEIYWELFDAVQLNGVFPDSKTFVDCIPRKPAREILSDFVKEADEEGFNLVEFVHRNFIVPETPKTLEIPQGLTLEERLHRQWDVLRRDPDEDIPESSLLELPHPYIVPGGRFREIYYWDSYFTMLGLKTSGKTDLIESMIDNFAYLINTVGHIPNGNRSYFLSRSQPPFFAKMVELLSEIKQNKAIIREYLPEIHMEYAFWTEGQAEVHLPGKRYKRVVMQDEDSFLNRYWDDDDSPRPESFLEDVELSEQTRRFPDKLFKNLRAACESGWDFSSRWLYEPENLKSVQTIALIPIDLNVLLSEMERILALGYELEGDEKLTAKFTKIRKNRIEAINRYCWNENRGIYLDYHIKFKEQMDRPSLAMLYPLWAGIVDAAQAMKVIEYVEKNFFKPGGLVTTNFNTGQQWDSPNGWAPLQWIGFEAFRKYGREDLAMQLAQRWTILNEQVFERTGKMMEKYNVEDLSLEAGGGEYPVQDGFGWTNGVYLAMKEIMRQNQSPKS
ncbi:Trehalase [Indibacter alkaliphilus LW1]|uniref:Trehalase n=1 Tax=Indibacter alkaliphilus (strain CCUG 57479 / KCTC 22604 / LW1) TaxID=1189612 RepID=S2D5F8_INDAL|nr:alpha,alpha-trehalase TreF [Indibacter alkaliphilus]EOZ92305.1 Trehalase [Indibacter alkaliphilus LW1]